MKTKKYGKGHYTNSKRHPINRKNPASAAVDTPDSDTTIDACVTLLSQQTISTQELNLDQQKLSTVSEHFVKSVSTDSACLEPPPVPISPSPASLAQKKCNNSKKGSKNIPSNNSIHSSLSSRGKVRFDLANNKVAQFKSGDRPSILANLLKIHCHMPTSPVESMDSLSLSPKKPAISLKSLKDYRESGAAAAIYDAVAAAESQNTDASDTNTQKNAGLKKTANDETPSAYTSRSTNLLGDNKNLVASSNSIKLCQKQNKKRKKLMQQSTEMTTDSNSERERESTSIPKKHATSRPSDLPTTIPPFEEAIASLVAYLSTSPIATYKDELPKLFSQYNISAKEQKACIAANIAASIKDLQRAVATNGKVPAKLFKEASPKSLSNGESIDTAHFPSAESTADAHMMAGPETSTICFQTSIPHVAIGSIQDSLFRRDSKLDVDSKDIKTVACESKNLVPDLTSIPKTDFYQTEEKLVFCIYIKNLTEADAKLVFIDGYPMITFPAWKKALKIMIELPIAQDRYEKCVNRYKIEVTLFKSIAEPYPKKIDMELVDFHNQPMTAETVQIDNESLIDEALFAEMNDATLKQNIAEETDAMLHLDELSDLSDSPRSSRHLSPVYMSQLYVDIKDTQSSVTTVDSTDPDFAVTSSLNENSSVSQLPMSNISANVWCGLLNEGVDCYFINIIQCLASIPEFSAYFIDGTFMSHLNRENPLSNSKGQMAEMFAKLLKDLTLSSRPFFPQALKRTLSKCWALYDSYTQQDAQEFLNFILDELHEDVNRIFHKPCIELPDFDDSVCSTEVAAIYWDAHAKRNDSIVVDMFQGQYKSRIKCKACGKSSIKFDAFMNLSMEIPQINVDFHFYFTPFGHPPHWNRLSVPALMSMDDLLEKISKAYNTQTENLMCGFLQDQHTIHKLDKLSGVVQDYLSFADTTPSIIIYEVPYDQTYLCISQFVTTLEDQDSASKASDGDEQHGCNQSVGFPILITLPKALYTHRELYIAIFKQLYSRQMVCGITLEVLMEIEEPFFTIHSDNNEDHDGIEKIYLGGGEQHVSLLWKNCNLFCKVLDLDKIQKPISGCIDDESPRSISFYDCIKQHLKEEEVDEWYCGNCKKHTNGLKKLDLWKLPKILIVHLKRFVFNPHLESWAKLESRVDYPLDDLEMGQFSVCDMEQFKRYELFAVSNHHGSTDSGHYVALCKRMNKWFKFDDELVEPAEFDSRYYKFGYVLFYRLKPNDTDILSTGPIATKTFLSKTLTNGPESRAYETIDRSPHLNPNLEAKG
ncbi:hypothetical protein QVD99_004986 [Batrachochytrium dendrobatidis]|nr:hypothetical protein QVD99_004986 [Batrachochytrium dendrobatidis]